MLPAPELAAAAVTALAPYLASAATEGAKKLGGAAAEHLVALYDRIKARLTSPLGQEAIAAVEKDPAAADAQATLRLVLGKRLTEDPAFYEELARWLAEIAPGAQAGVSLTQTTVGDGNVSSQIVGSGNQVQLGRSS